MRPVTHITSQADLLEAVRESIRLKGRVLAWGIGSRFRWYWPLLSPLFSQLEHFALVDSRKGGRESFEGMPIYLPEQVDLHSQTTVFIFSEYWKEILNLIMLHSEPNETADPTCRVVDCEKTYYLDRPKSKIGPVILASLHGSGTHLITPLLRYSLREYGFHCHEHWTNSRTPLERFKQLTPGDFVYGHTFSSILKPLFHDSKFSHFRYLVMYRDPRDQAISMMKKALGASFRPERHLARAPSGLTETQLLNRIIEERSKWYCEEVMAWKAVPNAKTIRYESIRLSPENGLCEILTWLGLEPDAHILRLAAFESSFERLSGRKPGQEGQSVFRKGVIGEWKTHFDEDLKASFKRQAGDLLVQLDYEKDLNW